MRVTLTDIDRALDGVAEAYEDADGLDPDEVHACRDALRDYCVTHAGTRWEWLIAGALSDGLVLAYLFGAVRDADEPVDPAEGPRARTERRLAELEDELVVGWKRRRAHTPATWLGMDDEFEIRIEIEDDDDPGDED